MILLFLALISGINFNIPDTIRVGEQFELIVTTDSTFSGAGYLSVITSDSIYRNDFIEPNLILFINGIADTNLIITRADTSMRLVCELLGNHEIDTSEKFVSLPGEYEKAVFVLNGQDFTPGLRNPVTGIPVPKTVGDIDTFAIYLTDSFSNPIWSQSDTFILWLHTDIEDTAFGELPDTLVVNEGDTVEFTSFVASSEVRIHGNSILLQKTFESSSIIFTPTTPRYVITILPGEIYYPGEYPGKKGTPLPQASGVPFNLYAFLVDTFFNKVTSFTNFQNDSLYILSEPEGIIDTTYNPTGPWFFVDSGGYATLSIPIRVSVMNGRYRLAVVDSTHLDLLNIPSSLEVVEFGDSMIMWVSRDTILAGSDNYVYARLMNRSGYPVPGKTIHFRILRGRGHLYPSYAATNENGVAMVVFKADPYSYGQVINIEGSFIWHDSTVVSKTVSFKIYHPYGEVLAFYPNPLGILSKRAKIGFIIPGDQRIDRAKIEIYDAFGNLVWKKLVMLSEIGVSPGETAIIEWDGKNSRGVRVATGSYLLVLRLMAGNTVVLKRIKMVGVIW